VQWGSILFQPTFKASRRRFVDIPDTVLPASRDKHWQYQEKTFLHGVVTPAGPAGPIVMNLLRLNTTRKASIKSKRMLAATIDEFRAELLWVMT
jgi:hypothetical protein